jgi:futalosine hydrolase
MKIALAAATLREIEPAQQYLAERLYLKGHHQFSIVLTGVGLMQTTYTLAKTWMRDKPDIAIQAGVGGSFHPLYEPGRVVVVHEDLIGDLGVKEQDWLDLFDMGLADVDDFPWKDGLLANPHADILKKAGIETVRGLSVNQVSTDVAMIRTLMRKFSPVVESMEGAAFHYFCLSEGIPFIQFRSISNRVGDRDKSNWQMSTAIQSLNNAVIQFINRIAEHPPHP